jgi:hypothetical protein
MGDRLLFEVLTPPKIKITRVDDAGNLVNEKTVNDKLYTVKDAAKSLGVKWESLDRYLCEVRHKGLREVDLNPQPEKQPTVFLLRGLKQKAIEGRTFNDIWSALAAECSVDDPIIEWDSTEEWCVLDLDFHRGDVPDATDLRQSADTIRPMPCAWWYSRSGSLHLLYAGGDKLSADECASLASVKLLARFPAARIELKHSTRQPSGEVFRAKAGYDAGTIPASNGVEQSDFTDYLEEHGYEVGKRYPHTRCPVNPSPRAEGNTEPVVVKEKCIRCYICEADGIKRGSKQPGFFPLSFLAGTIQQSLFRRCIENFTHWQHAKYIVCQVIPQENLAALVYRAALKQKWGGDPRIPLVWSAGPKTGLIRCDGYWMGESGRSKAYKDTSAVLAGLPVCKFLDKNDLDENGKPKLKTSAAILEELASTDDLTAYGYPAVIRVWGIQLTQMQDPPTNRIFTLLQRNGTPEYLPTKRRMPEEEAWGLLESLYPGLNRKAVELLIVAKGCTEFRAGLPPMLFLTGPTGAGKTQSINLAASICGDAATVVTYASEEDRLRAGILSAKERGSFAFFDEYLKRAKAKHIEPDAAIEFILNLTEDSLSHKLYTGPVPLGELPVCVFADTALPAEVVAHSQIARRMHHVPMRESKQWNKSTKELRQEGEEYCKAADSIVSYAMDRWFPPGPPTDFAVVAKALGFHLFNSNEAAKVKEDLIRKFFDLVCAASEAKAGGWKQIDPNGVGELADTWLALGDYKRALTEVDLKKVLGVNDVVECEVQKARSGRILVRFTSVKRDKINEQLRAS